MSIGSGQGVNSFIEELDAKLRHPGRRDSRCQQQRAFVAATVHQDRPPWDVCFHLVVAVLKITPRTQE